MVPNLNVLIAKNKIQRHLDSYLTLFRFAKGLGAPIGSVLLGDKDNSSCATNPQNIRRRNASGGLFGCSGLYALDISRLGEDHRRAKRTGTIKY
jgi:threonine aldolase